MNTVKIPFINYRLFICVSLRLKSLFCSVFLFALLSLLTSPLLTLTGSKLCLTWRPPWRPPARTSAPSWASSSATPASWRSMLSLPVTWATLSLPRQEASDSLTSVYNLHDVTSPSLQNFSLGIFKTFQSSYFNF